MPADDALRFDQDKMPTPVAAAEGADRNPEQFVLGAETRSLPSRPGQYRELMAEQEILGHERIAVADGGTGKAEEKKQVLDHRPEHHAAQGLQLSRPTFAPSHRSSESPA